MNVKVVADLAKNTVAPTSSGQATTQSGCVIAALKSLAPLKKPATGSVAVNLVVEVPGL